MPKQTAPRGNEKIVLTLDNVAERYQISGRHWQRMYLAGKAPAPLRVGNALRWRLSDLLAWEESGGTSTTTPRQRKQRAN